MSDTVIAEGAVKIRDGKKWRSRWLVLRKPSPVADCLVLYMFKERGVKERSSLTLEHICGLETSVGSDSVPFALSILCLSQTAVIGFDSKEVLQSWDLRLRYCLGEVHSFGVSVLPGTKLESGAATLHLCNNVLVIAKEFPAVIIGHWNLLDLRRYGPVNSGFVFEGGTRCGYWAGVFFLSCAEGEQISFLFDCIVRGISPSRGPFGLKTLLPETSVSAALVQDRLNHEAEELERRLSLLSHSTVSSSRFGSSTTGDDHSLSGSSDASDTSQSDCSIIRPTPWTDLLLPGSEMSQIEASQVEVKLSVRPADPIRSRKLKESGRQNSSDSGIATGSHSSYTGSFSSYSGSLDAAGPVEDYGVLLDKHLCTCEHEYQVPTSLRYLYDTPRSLLEISGDSKAHDDAGLTQPITRKEYGEISESLNQSDSCSALALEEGEESVKGEEPQEFSCNKSCCDYTVCSLPPSGCKSLFNSCPICGGLLKGSFPAHPGGSSLPSVSAGEHSAPPPAGPPTNQEPAEISETNQNPRKPSSECSAANEEKRSEDYVSCLSDLLSHYSPAGKSDGRGVYEAMGSRRSGHSKHTVLYENCVQCRTGEGSCRLLRSAPPSRDASVPQSPSSPVSLQRIPEEVCADRRETVWTEKVRPDPAYEIMDSRAGERNSERDERSRSDACTSSGAVRDPQHLSQGAVFVFPADAPAASDRLRDAVTYVNIPISPTSKKQLNYLELELQESSAGVRGRSSSKYAHIDITATEAAHRAVTQHALGREEGLQRRRRRRRSDLRDANSEE